MERKQTKSGAELSHNQISIVHTSLKDYISTVHMRISFQGTGNISQTRKKEKKTSSKIFVFINKNQA